MKKVVELIVSEMEENSSKDLARHSKENGELPPPDRQENPGHRGNIPQSAFPGLSTEDVDFLGRIVTKEEIRVALFDMAPLKDGFQATFFQNHWDTIGDALCEWNLKNFSQFWPISLCSVFYKLVMKVIANRFKSIFPKTIRQEQVGFITGRSIIDNVIIAQEVLHSMRVKKNLKWMAIKINLEKAFDRVCWDFIEASLIAAGSLELCSYSKVWPVRGIRQGYPLSPYLFVLCMEWLGHRFHGSISTEEWSPARLSCKGPSLSHLFFADDLVIFSQADLKHSGLLKNFLSDFCEISGHKVNARKTTVFFSSGVNVSLRNTIIGNLGFQEVNDLGHYLRVLLLHKRLTKSILDFLVEKVHSRLSSWDAKKLAFARRVTLAQSILLTIPSYLMQSTIVPKEVCDAIEELAKQFIQGCLDSKRKMALIKWDDICQPKINGGLGLHRLEDQNKAFMMKIGYNLITKSEALWVQVLKSKYGMCGNMLTSIMRSNCSYMWRVVAKVWALLCSNMIWTIGNGRTVRCWEDTWVPNKGPLKHYVSDYGTINSEITVNNMVSPNGYWYLDLFRLGLPKDIVKCILSIPPPSAHSGPDSLSWSKTTSRIFSVKSAYYLFKEESWHLNEESWNMLWKLPGSYRVKHFIWLILKQRVRRGIAHNTACHLCGHSIEDSLHTLRDCPFANEIWH
ncbi:hypothetical protein J1N35_043786 [Gossypium stocksii]|uniref:Reverse transcriptase domain-containing protein n=1 Tax=Gossypium stocksii TaxID=47602 RepID=A0A9D3ZFA2_9ROSI|nr:hypothetical protein J1N35_043786 [Gossypium stocksii]